MLALAGDLLTEFFSLDGRHLRTAVQLLSPGRLTLLFREGKRASLVPPVRVYFVTSLLFFLLVGIPSPDASNFNVYVDDVLVGRDQPDPKLGDLQLLNIDSASWTGKRVQSYFATKFEVLQAMEAQELVDRFFTGLERTIPTTLICFVPLLALALKLLYIRRPFYYVDHLVLALHFQSFLFVLMVVVHFVKPQGTLAAILSYLAAFLLIVPAYLLLALRRVYAQSWLLTVIKGVLLALIYLFIIQPVILVNMFLVIRTM